MIEEMRSNFEPLLHDYPSGMGVNSLLGAKYFGLRQNQVVVGNGAAELIKSLISIIDGRLGVIYPTFEEYPNRLPASRLEIFYPQNDCFTYTESDLKDYFTSHPVENILLINPDNPSGNFIPAEDLHSLIQWTEHKKIRLIFD